MRTFKPPTLILYYHIYYINIYVELLYYVLARTEEPAKASICARDRRALQQLALNVHVKHSKLTCCIIILHILPLGAHVSLVMWSESKYRSVLFCSVLFWHCGLLMHVLRPIISDFRREVSVEDSSLFIH